MNDQLTLHVVNGRFNMKTNALLIYLFIYFFAYLFIFQHSSLAYPGFSWVGGANSQSECANLLFCKFFAENYMKMKEFGPGGARPWRPNGSANAHVMKAL